MNLVILRRITRLVLALMGRLDLVLMFFSSLAISGIELVGLALIYPMLAVLTEQQFSARLKAIFADCGLGGLFDSQRDAIVVVGGIIFLFYFVKTVLHGLLLDFQSKKVAGLNVAASELVITSALNSRFQLFLDHGASKIAAISYSNAGHVSLILQSFLGAVNELILLLMMFSAVLIFYPVKSLLAGGVVAVVLALYLKPFSRHVTKLGRDTHVSDLARHRFVFTMASAIKDIKIMGLERFFIAQNSSIVRGHSELARHYTLASSFQRIILEFIVLSLIVATCIWLGFSSTNILEVAPLVVTGGLMAMRALPAANRLSQAYSAMRYSMPLVEALNEMLEVIEHYPQPRVRSDIDLRDEIRLEGVCFAYKGIRILNGIDLVIPGGHVIGIIGASGSGKSTLLDLISGLQEPSDGRFLLAGKPFSPFANREFTRQIGYVPQSIAILDGSIAYNIALEENPDMERLRRAVGRARLDGLADSLPQGLNTPLGEGAMGLSGGQRQRIGVARALYREPALLVLDEVTSALDPQTEVELMNELLQLRGHTTIVIVTHKRATVASADAVYRIDNGTLVKESAFSGP